MTRFCPWRHKVCCESHGELGVAPSPMDAGGERSRWRPCRSLPWQGESTTSVFGGFVQTEGPIAGLLFCTEYFWKATEYFSESTTTTITTTTRHMRSLPPLRHHVLLTDTCGHQPRGSGYAVERSLSDFPCRTDADRGRLAIYSCTCSLPAVSQLLCVPSTLLPKTSKQLYSS